ncbi:MAG: PPC domain-containing DNA-binding protein [Candidatus Thorarchaeota archaeon]
MKCIETKSKRIFIGKVEPEKDLIDSIIEMVKKHNIKSGIINCIGALKKFTIGFFEIESKEYKLETFNENVELLTCMGNIAFKDDEPIIHLHVSLGRKDYSIIGGHLSKPSIVSVTGEVIMFEIDKELNRTTDPQFNLSLLNI